MCLMMWKPAHAVLTKRDVYDYVKHNPDGFGVAWIGENGRVNTFKMVGGKKAVWRAYQAHAAGRDCALHFRMATSGLINLDMTHPFKVTDDTVMMHNGVLACKSTATRSDTAHFAEIMARELEKKPERLDDEQYIKALDDVIGAGNRLLFMRDGQPEPTIVGKAKGVEHNGCWYSNCYAWTNDYYDPNDWYGYRSWANWDNDKEPIIDFKFGTTTRTAEDSFEPVTGREKNAVRDVKDWLETYQYADPEQVVDYFVNFYARDEVERIRLRQVCEYAANCM